MRDLITLFTLALIAAGSLNAATPPTREGFLATVKFAITTIPPVAFTPHSTGECEVVRQVMDRSYQIGTLGKPFVIADAANLVSRSMAIIKSFRPDQHSSKCQVNALAMVQNARVVVDSIERGNPRPEDLNQRLSMWMKAYCRQAQLELEGGRPSDLAQSYRDDVLGFLSHLFNEAPLPPNMEGTDNPNGWWNKEMVPWEPKWFTPPVFRTRQF